MPTRPFTDIPAEQLDQILPGNFARFTVGDFALGLYRPTPDDWGNLRALDEFVHSSETDTYNEELGLFVYWMHAPHLGCVLGHTAIGEDEYDDFWMGGYHDVWHSSSFDYAGRSIKDHEYAFRGLSGPTDNLTAPDVEIRDDGGIRIHHTEEPPQWTQIAR